MTARNPIARKRQSYSCWCVGIAAEALTETQPQKADDGQIYIPLLPHRPKAHLHADSSLAAAASRSLWIPKQNNPPHHRHLLMPSLTSFGYKVRKESFSAGDVENYSPTRQIFFFLLWSLAVPGLKLEPNFSGELSNLKL